MHPLLVRSTVLSLRRRLVAVQGACFVVHTGKGDVKALPMLYFSDGSAVRLFGSWKLLVSRDEQGPVCSQPSKFEAHTHICCSVVTIVSRLWLTFAGATAVVERERAAGREVSVMPLPIFSAATRATSFILAHFFTVLQACDVLINSQIISQTISLFCV